MSLSERQKGKGSRRNVSGTNPLPATWADFLCVDDKTDLFHFLAEHILLKLPHLGGRILVTTYDTQFFGTNNNQYTSELEPCQAEEAYSRSMIHVADRVKRGHRRVAIKNVDTDVVALSIAAELSYVLHLVQIN